MTVAGRHPRTGDMLATSALVSSATISSEPSDACSHFATVRRLTPFLRELASSMSSIKEIALRRTTR